MTAQNPPSYFRRLTVGSARGLSVLFTVTLIVGCAAHDPAPSVTPKAKPQRPEASSQGEAGVGSGDAGGHYSALRLSGDYAGYPRLERFIDKMADERGFSRDYLHGLFSQAERKQWTLNYLSKEKPSAPPSPGAWTRYRAKFLDDRHISAGASFWQQHAGALQRASQEYGVSPEHIMGIMGVETIYGANLGNHRILDALTTLAYDYPRRADYFEEELEKFLIMCRNERLDPSRPKGSYAGAMGLGQFMPSSFLDYAVDFDGDGRKNLWDAEDAIGSIANYFSGHGWKTGRPVVTRAVVSGLDVESLKTGFDARYPLTRLADYGINPARDFPAETSARLLKLRTDHGDDYWLGFDNFYVITRYNHSTHYAMAVHQLAEAVKARYRDEM